MKVGYIMKRLVLLLMCAAIMLSLAACGWLVDVDESTAPPSESPSLTESTPEPTAEVTPETSPSETPPPREAATGKSDKSVDTLISKSGFSKKATTVRNDVTGNWRYCGFSEVGVDFTEYALSYYNEYFKADNEVHAVINFATNATYSITCASGVLFVSVYERVDGEEHDAKIMFSGMSLGDCIVHLDNGDIEVIE